jgi:hypothetical protein
MKNAVFWDVAPLCEPRFGGTYCLHLQGRKIRERETSVSRWLQQPHVHAGSALADFYNLKVEAICSSETWFTQWRHIPEDGILHSHRRENLKYYKVSN